MQGKALQVKRKKQVNKFPTAFRKMALERLKSCRNVTELSAELGIHRTHIVIANPEPETAVLLGTALLLAIPFARRGTSRR